MNMPYNPEIHHRHSIRLKDYDYSRSGAYFLTLCTWRRECLLGDIADGEMLLNDMGRIVLEAWERLGTRYEHVHLGEWIIMPNHLHGIIVIDDYRRDSKGGSRTAPTGRKPLGQLIGAFKTVSTKEVNRLRDNHGCPLWQRNYYERVIRNEGELLRACEYIVNNPMKWESDSDNPMNHL
jgi:REP element-mobilizing transposase RayT